MTLTKIALGWSIAFTLFFSQVAYGADLEETFTVFSTTENCKDTKTLPQSICLPQDYIADFDTPAIVSAAGNKSEILSIDKGRPTQNCITVTTVVTPRGESCLRLLGNKICNCKGRGWIELKITLRGNRALTN